MARSLGTKLFQGQWVAYWDCQSPKVFPFFCSAILKLSKSIGCASPHGHKMASTAPSILFIHKHIPSKKEERAATQMPTPHLFVPISKGNLFPRGFQ